MTRAELDAMAQKLDYLRNVAMPRTAKLTQELAGNGDFSENAEYQIAKGKLRGINRTISELEYQIPRAVVIETPADTQSVQIGHKVTVELIDGAKQQWQILGSSESDPTRGVISYQSPIGQALLGRKLSDKVVVELPAGELAVVIVDIQ